MTETEARAVSPILVAIDGPAGSGKSSVSRAAAAQLHFGILDTGAAYRALAWAARESGCDLDSEPALTDLLREWRYSSVLVGTPQMHVTLPGAERPVEVTTAIRAPEVSSQVSRVSKHPAVRKLLNQMFRDIVATSGLPGVVIEGRDITTVVAPDAPVRLLLTASPEVRAARRAGELPGATADAVLQDLQSRDAKDALVVDFQNPAPGVTLIDTSDLSFEQSVQAVIDAVTAVQTAAARGASR